MDGVERHRSSILEPALGGGDAGLLARVDGDRRLQHPRQRLEAGLGDMVVVAAVEVLDMERDAGVLRQRLENSWNSSLSISPM